MVDVSIIIPMYNSSSSIIRALQSIANQTYQGITEIIVVDDGSTDNSFELVKSYSETLEMNNIRIFRQSNGGVSSARNRAIKDANGTFIAFLDSDDEWLPSKISKQVDFFSNYPDYAFVGCIHNSISLFPVYKAKNGYYTVSLRKMLLKMAPQTSTAMLKKEVFQKTGFFDESQKYAEDGNLWFRICHHFKMAIIDENLVLCGSGKPGFGHSGLSANIYKMQIGEMKNIKELLKLKEISIFEYIFFMSYSILKYIRRFLRVKINKTLQTSSMYFK